ncbi:MAG TPA: hypothetical protein VG895_01960 [Patescibacteria group bacterium]|nr:hypothetical protein [Patescibacteria group bacterium]
MPIKDQLVYCSYGKPDSEAIVLQERELTAGEKLENIVYMVLDSGYQPQTLFGDIEVIDPDTINLHLNEQRWFRESYDKLSKNQINDIDPLYEVIAGEQIAKIKIQEKRSFWQRNLLKLKRKDINFNDGEVYRRVHWTPSKER